MRYEYVPPSLPANVLIPEDERAEAEARVHVKRALRRGELDVNPSAVKVTGGTTGLELAGWYAEGRVPGPRGRGYVAKTYGPFASAHEAAVYGRERRLGGQRVYEVREHVVVERLEHR